MDETDFSPPQIDRRLTMVIQKASSTESISVIDNIAEDSDEEYAYDEAQILQKSSSDEEDLCDKLKHLSADQTHELIRKMTLNDHSDESKDVENVQDIDLADKTDKQHSADNVATKKNTKIHKKKPKKAGKEIKDDPVTRDNAELEPYTPNSPTKVGEIESKQSKNQKTEKSVKPKSNKLPRENQAEVKEKKVEKLVNEIEQNIKSNTSPKTTRNKRIKGDTAAGERKGFTDNSNPSKDSVTKVNDESATVSSTGKVPKKAVKTTVLKSKDENSIQIEDKKEGRTAILTRAKVKELNTVKEQHQALVPPVEKPANNKAKTSRKKKTQEPTECEQEPEIEEKISQNKKKIVKHAKETPDESTAAAVVTELKTKQKSKSGKSKEKEAVSDDKLVDTKPVAKKKKNNQKKKEPENDPNLLVNTVTSTKQATHKKKN